MRTLGGTSAPAGKQPVDIYLEVEDVNAAPQRSEEEGVSISDPLPKHALAPIDNGQIGYAMV